jgi:hypothetical protein
MPMALRLLMQRAVFLRQNLEMLEPDCFAMINLPQGQVARLAAK